MGCTTSKPDVASQSEPSALPPPLLLEDPNTKYEVKLILKENVTHNVRRFRFALPSERHALGLPTGQFVYFMAEIDGAPVIRPYTPVTNDNEHRGYFEIVAKVYFKDIDPARPLGGKMSQHLNSLEPGSILQVRGPSGNLLYPGRGLVQIRKNKTSPYTERKITCLGMVAGGSGITPMLQFASAVFRDAGDTTKVWLVYCNQTRDDIICKTELENLQRKFPDRFFIWYTLTRETPPNWPFSLGHLNLDMLRGHLPPPAEDTLITVCGPTPMVKECAVPHLLELGYSSEKHIFIF